jgi:hypothetical protein
MTNHPKRVLKSAAIAAVILAIGAVVWWKTAQHRTSSSSPLATESSRLSETLPSAATNIAQKQDAPAPIDETRAAHITIAGTVHVLAPNVRGEFPRLIVPASATITATVPFAEAEPGEVIPVQAEDGGLLQDVAAQGSLAVDKDHKVTVSYQVSAYDGMHRVTLRRGGESRVLEFWVGAETPVLVRN